MQLVTTISNLYNRQNMEKLLRQIEQLGNHDHICLIYRNQKEQFATAIPYMRIGLQRGDQCMYITDDNTKRKVIHAMKKDGIDVDTALKKRALIFATKNDSYLKGGSFDPDALIKNVLVKAALDAKKDGYSSLRITGEMTWALGSEPGNDRLVEYEAKLNYFFPKYNASAICQYNQKRFPPRIIKDVIYMHPIVAYGGSVNKNYHYIPPKDFLEKNTDAEKVKQLLKSIHLTEEAMQERHRVLRQFETVLFHLPSAVIVAEAPSGKIMITNPQVEKIWRQSLPQVYTIGDYKRYKGFYLDGRAYKAKDWPLARSILKGEVVSNEEIMILRGDGTYGYISSSAAPIRDNEGKIIAGVVTFSDITEKMQQQKQKDEFMGIVSHELKTPVTSLKAFAQVLQHRFSKAGDEQSAKHLSKMDAQINKLAVLISDLLDVTKIEAGKLQFHNDLFSFDELVDEIIDQVQLTTTKHTIHKEGRTNQKIYGDKERIGQVLMNLLTNAIKYSPMSDKVIVKTKRTDHTIMCSVQDFGVGIDKSQHDKVFERFYRVVGNEELTYPGLGLGLYISDQIMKRQGGTLSFESEKGKGSTFTFSLPLTKRKIMQQKNISVEREIAHE